MKRRGFAARDFCIKPHMSDDYDPPLYQHFKQWRETLGIPVKEPSTKAEYYRINRSLSGLNGMQVSDRY